MFQISFASETWQQFQAVLLGEENIENTAFSLYNVELLGYLYY